MPVHNAIRLSEGQRFNRWTFVRDVGSSPGGRNALFRCDCGRERVVQTNRVCNGYSASCGSCVRSAAATKHGHCKDGKSSREYETWRAMLKRCLEPTHPAFQHYGARGIGVCKRWLSFDKFIQDMGSKPRGMTLERKNNARGYSPSNCVWASVGAQNRNRRGNTLLTFRGRTLTLVEWSEIVGIKDCTLSERLRRGWTIERAFSEKTRKYRASG